MRHRRIVPGGLGQRSPPVAATQPAQGKISRAEVVQTRWQPGQIWHSDVKLDLIKSPRAGIGAEEIRPARSLALACDACSEVEQGCQMRKVERGRCAAATPESLQSRHAAGRQLARQGQRLQVWVNLEQPRKVRP